MTDKTILKDIKNILKGLPKERVNLIIDNVKKYSAYIKETKSDEKLKDACKRYMDAVKGKIPDIEREKIFYEIKGIKSIIEQDG